MRSLAWTPVALLILASGPAQAQARRAAQPVPRSAATGGTVRNGAGPSAAKATTVGGVQTTRNGQPIFFQPTMGYQWMPGVGFVPVQGFTPIQGFVPGQSFFYSPGMTAGMGNKSGMPAASGYAQRAAATSRAAAAGSRSPQVGDTPMGPNDVAVPAEQAQQVANEAQHVLRAEDLMEDRPFRLGTVVNVRAGVVDVAYEVDGRTRMDSFPPSEVFFFAPSGALMTAAAQPQMIRIGSRVLVPQRRPNEPSSGVSGSRQETAPAKQVKPAPTAPSTGTSRTGSTSRTRRRR
jgi:hypothetical protein